MRTIAITMILILTVPAICLGSIGPAHRLDLPEVETSGWEAYRLVVRHTWTTDDPQGVNLDFAPGPEYGISSVSSLNRIKSGLPWERNLAPRDMISMMSFVWAQTLGGVDIVAEVKDFARQVKHRGRYSNVHRNNQRDTRNRWKFIVSCRIDGQTEVAAHYNNRGRLFGDGRLALEINALDPMSEEIGLTMAFRDGYLDIRADRMTLTEKAAAKIMVKF